MKTINVRTSRPYDVIIERGSLAKSGELISRVISSKKAVIITDDTVEALYADVLADSLGRNGINASVFAFPHGEQSKNLATLGRIYDFLCSERITRSDFLIALGGGVVGDITGFAAASFLRGIEFVQIPTTLLAQVDSSVGGKTAIDIAGGKNLVGAFKQPALVICDSDTLKTLPQSELSCGMAEVIKYGMIRDSELFEILEKHNISTIDDVMDDIVYTCIDIKRDVVEHDEFDRGERMILNFGHTLGHAIEGWHNYTDYTHGMGVAVGMCLITERLCGTEITERLRKCIEAYELPTATEAPMSELLLYCSTDKKCESSGINYIVCREIGRAEICKVTVAEFEKLMEG
ncbi:MAG: 3-dehydroquinate synthase [Ruminococcus flavefaciens]|nr:3-dehydroquinate synthase [Ruminococcus flavefaciens]MCM1229558.1 3-dehydroquinate synthase [Ruminococcus flavefaciens]